MAKQALVNKSVLFAILITSVLIAGFSASVTAQSATEIADMKRDARGLIRQQKFLDALPIYEKLVALEPSSADSHFYLAFGILAKVNTEKDPASRKSLRLRARSEFLKAKQLGLNEPQLDGLIQSIPEDGGDPRAYSSNSGAHEFMTQAEAFFSQGKLDDAFNLYQKALQLDPKLYEAALYCGDVRVQQGKFDEADTWYKKAIEINPNRETAYRYSATPLMRQGKVDQARDRYIDAFISEPANKLAVGGLVSWGQAAKASLGHPNIPVPDDVAFDENGRKLKDPISVELLTSQDGSAAWAAYAATRTLWKKEKFAKTFPNESQYRHSLAEETEALRAVVSGLAAAKAPLSAPLAKLKQIASDGLLEPYILLARLDNGIYVDYAAYLTQNREKLRRYVIQYVITAGGK